MKNLLLLLFLSLVNNIYANSFNLDSLYTCLDDEIQKSSMYISKHENSISALKRLLESTDDDGDKYRLSFGIYKEYKAYINDSAIVYLDKCVAYSEKMNRYDLTSECKSLLAFQCSTSGMYAESLEILMSIDRKRIPREHIGAYFIALNHLYSELSFYTQEKMLKDSYLKKAKLYRDSIYMSVDHLSEDYLLKREMQLLDDGNAEEALKINDLRMEKVKYGTHEFAIVSYYRSQIYRAMNNPEYAKYWLALSAISDIRNAVMDHASLWTLADILSREGELDRSYKYIRFSWNATTVFNARVRSWLASPILSMIDNNYQNATKQTNKKLRAFIGIISVLSILLLAGVIYVNNQRKRLSLARNQLKVINSQLEELNEELSLVNSNLDKTNKDLSDVNKKLSDSNLRLNESNRVKEEYIGRFLSLCSIYIDKLDGFRKLVNKKMKSNDSSELFKITNSFDFKEKELNELYTNFDDAFLNLFPNFVEEFNALIHPEQRIAVNDRKTLTTELRIFALIRLGIDDSSKIAEFLHYSVNTIYNYRARVKNSAIINRDEFELRIKSIGLSV